MTAPLERLPAPDMVRDLTLCGLAQQSFCADTVWCLTCWRWLFKQSAYTGGADRQNYIATVLSSLAWAARPAPTLNLPSMRNLRGNRPSAKVIEIAFVKTLDMLTSLRTSENPQSQIQNFQKPKRPEHTQPNKNQIEIPNIQNKQTESTYCLFFRAGRNPGR